MIKQTSTKKPNAKSGSSQPTNPDDAKRLSKAKRLIEAVLVKQGRAHLEIGTLLRDAKGDLAHGTFLAWVEANLPFGQRTAQIYMRIAEAIPGDLPQFQKLQLRTLKELSSEKLPDSVRKVILEEIEDGDLVSDKAIQERISHALITPEQEEKARQVRTERDKAMSRAATMLHSVLGDQIEELVKALRAAGISELAKLVEDIATTPEKEPAETAEAVAENSEAEKEPQIFAA